MTKETKKPAYGVMLACEITLIHSHIKVSMKSHFTESEDSGNKYTQAHMKQDSNDTQSIAYTNAHQLPGII